MMDFGNIMGGQNPYAGQDTGFGDSIRSLLMKQFNPTVEQPPAASIAKAANLARNRGGFSQPLQLQEDAPVQYAPTEMTGWAPEKGGLNAGGLPSYGSPQNLSMMMSLLRGRQ